MSTHNTHYATTNKPRPVKTRFSSFFPVPSSWLTSPSCHTLGNFYSSNDTLNFIVGVYFNDGSYFFDFTSLNNHILSCSFTSLRNCLLGLKSTSKCLNWKVDSKWFLCDSYKLPPVKEDFHEF